jgi:hypothetical protein
MSKLEELQTNASVQGILPNSLVSVVSVQWFGSEALELTYKDQAVRRALLGQARRSAVGGGALAGGVMRPTGVAERV